MVFVSNSIRYSSALHKLIFAMLRVPPEERPSVEEILEMINKIENG